MHEEDIKLLAKAGWQVECHSPFEIRHEDGSFATEQAAYIVLDSIREEYNIMSFEELALGSRFKYLDGKSNNIWIKISNDNLGLIVEYDDEYMKYPNWLGQKACSFADSEEQMKELKVILWQN